MQNSWVRSIELLSVIFVFWNIGPADDIEINFSKVTGLYDTDIEVDGGITRENIGTVLDAGANVIVMGSSVFKGDIEDNMKYYRDFFDSYTPESRMKG